MYTKSVIQLFSYSKKKKAQTGGIFRVCQRCVGQRFRFVPERGLKILLCNLFLLARVNQYVKEWGKLETLNHFLLVANEGERDMHDTGYSTTQRIDCPAYLIPLEYLIVLLSYQTKKPLLPLIELVHRKSLTDK